MLEEAVQTKRCNRCNQPKPVSEFGKNRSRRDGLQHYCKACWREYESTPYQRSMRLAQVRRYQATDKGKATSKRADEKRKGSQQVKARAKVRDRVAKGKMPPASSLPCVRCNRPAHEYHHHLGYDPPNDLDVIPVCRECHRKEV